MGYVCILFLFIINTALTYYLYNPVTHDLIIRRSLQDIPKGYKLVPPPRNYTRRSRLSRENQHCSDGGFKCNAPYDKALTFQFECSNDDNCPSNYKCCSQKCFLHKICVRTAKPSPLVECKRWPYNCRRPYDYSFTSRFRCDRNNQCPKNYRCCQQSCFLHKICSRVATRMEKPPERVQAAVTAKSAVTEAEVERTTTSTTTEATTTIEEEVDEVSTDEDYDEIEATTGAEEEQTITFKIDTPVAEIRLQATEEEEMKTSTKETENDDEETTTFKIELIQQVTQGQSEKEEVPETTAREDNVTNLPKPTTLDSNAINPNENSDYYDNGDDEEDGYGDGDEEEEYEYEDENGDN